VDDRPICMPRCVPSLCYYVLDELRLDLCRLIYRHFVISNANRTPKSEFLTAAGSITFNYGQLLKLAHVGEIACSLDFVQ
jgi:hypothetical protein